MQVLILENVPASVRGELSRWFLEPKAGVFVGRVSALVRDQIWDKICGECRGGGSLLIYRSDSPQGFTMRTHGRLTRQLRDFDGLQLVKI